MEGLKKKNWKFGLEAKAETFQIAKFMLQHAGAHLLTWKLKAAVSFLFNSWPGGMGP